MDYIRILILPIIIIIIIDKKTNSHTGEKKKLNSNYKNIHNIWLLYDY